MSSRNPGLLALALVGLLLPAFAAAEIYKCTNADGEVEYRNMPCENGAQQEAVTLRETTVVPAVTGWPGVSGNSAPEMAWSVVTSTRIWVRTTMAQYHITGLHIVALIYLVMSLVSFFTYRYDKQVAIDDIGRRVSETTMHWQEALGGWPGAWIAQRVLRHKTIKPSYQTVFWLIVFSHVLLWVEYLRGFPWLRALVDLLR